MNDSSFIGDWLDKIKDFNSMISGGKNFLWLVLLPLPFFKKSWKKIWLFLRPPQIDRLAARFQHINEKTMEAIRAQFPIAVVDDTPTSYRGTRILLDSMGYHNIVDMYPIDFDDGKLKKHLLYLIDIKGVAFKGVPAESMKYQGLDVAKEIKQRHPAARVCVYSASIEEYQDNYILEGIMDGKFGKDDNEIDKKKKIDDFVLQLVNPIMFWQWYHQYIIKSCSSKEVSKMESRFATKLALMTEYNLKDVAVAMRTLSDPAGVAELVANELDAIGR